jgi:hypothetical protein
MGAIAPKKKQKFIFQREQSIFNEFKMVAELGPFIKEQIQYDAVARCLCDFPRNCRRHDLNMTP